MSDPFAAVLDAWGLEPDGTAFETHTSHLLPVLRGEEKLFLKISTEEEEIRGGALLAHWQVEPLAQVVRHEGNALLLVRAEAGPDLAKMADLDAMDIVCDVVGRLHAARPPAVRLQSLEARFSSLLNAIDPEMNSAKELAAKLLETQRGVACLHGDIHHGNILKFQTGGWRAIDPKGVYGERAYDYANLICNPSPERALAPGVMAARLERVSKAADLDPVRLAQWVMAHANLSACWSKDDGDDPEPALKIARLAADFAEVT